MSDPGVFCPLLWNAISQTSLKVLLEDPDSNTLRTSVNKFDYYQHLRVVQQYNASLLGGHGVGLKIISRLLDGYNTLGDIQASINGFRTLCEAADDTFRSGRVKYPCEMAPLLEKAIRDHLLESDKYVTRTLALKHVLPVLLELYMHVTSGGFEVIKPYLDHKDITYILVEMSSERLQRLLGFEKGVEFYLETIKRAFLEDVLFKKVVTDLSKNTIGLKILRSVMTSENWAPKT